MERSVDDNLGRFRCNVIFFLHQNKASGEFNPDMLLYLREQSIVDVRVPASMVADFSRM